MKTSLIKINIILTRGFNFRVYILSARADLAIVLRISLVTVSLYLGHFPQGSFSYYSYSIEIFLGEESMLNVDKW